MVFILFLVLFLHLTLLIIFNFIKFIESVVTVCKFSAKFLFLGYLVFGQTIPTSNYSKGFNDTLSTNNDTFELSLASKVKSTFLLSSYLTKSSTTQNISSVSFSATSKGAKL